MAFKTIIQALKLYLHSLQSLFNLLLRFDVAPLPPLPPPSSSALHSCFICCCFGVCPWRLCPEKGPGPTQIYDQQSPRCGLAERGISRLVAIKAHVARVPASPCRANIMSNPACYRINPDDGLKTEP